MYIQNELIAVDLRLGKMVMSPSFRNLALDNAGQLWLGTKQGLLFSRKFAKLVPETPVPMIVDIQVNGMEINFATQMTFTSGLFMQAEFTSLCYPAEKIRYQTRLVRVNGDGSFVDSDTAWSEAHREAEQLFPSVPTGEYVLHIRAQQEGYLWSIPTSYRFSVQPAWYVRWWVILLYLACIIGLMFGAARWWAWRLARKNRVLKRLVEERTQEIQRQVFILDEQAREIELANTRLQEQNVQLIDLNNEKNDFLGIAAHDLKNPLTGIMMTVSTMRNYFDRMTRDDLTTQLLRIENTARRMHSIITELLDVNAIETGNFSLHLSDFDITPILQSVVEDFRERAMAKEIALHLELQPNVKLVNADATAIVQVLENIISNAVKYSPNGKNVFVSLADNGSHTVRVFVRDEGPGLSPEDKERLFVKFAKLSARPTAGESSTGLGLSIVKRMVEAMHGQVLCESELGAGATFILEFAAAVGQS
jgi:signal transduction histidine kinase